MKRESKQNRSRVRSGSVLGAHGRELEKQEWKIKQGTLCVTRLGTAVPRAPWGGPTGTAAAGPLTIPGHPLQGQRASELHHRPRTHLETSHHQQRWCWCYCCFFLSPVLNKSKLLSARPSRNLTTTASCAALSADAHRWGENRPKITLSLLQGVGSAGGYFNTSIAYTCICFLTETCLGPEMALHSVKPMLGCERRGVVGHFLWEHSVCGGASGEREEGNKQQAGKLQGTVRGPKMEVTLAAVRSEQSSKLHSKRKVP